VSVRRRPVRDAAVKRSPILGKHWRSLKQVDGFLQGCHKLARGNGRGARIQLVGGTLYNTIGAKQRGTTTTFDDVDLRLTGLTVAQVLAVVKRSFPGVDLHKHVTHKQPYHKGISHVQVDVPRKGQAPLQLDISVYKDPTLFRKPHQWVSFARLKLDIKPSQRLSSLLLKATDVDRARRMPQLLNPSGRGIKDLLDKTIHVKAVPGMDQKRVVEGLMHAAYLVGKKGKGLRLDNETRKMYAQMDGGTLRAFFSKELCDPGVAGRRAGYVLSAFRPKAGRSPLPLLRMGRRTGLWQKLLPGLAEVTNDVGRWRRTMQMVRHAHRYATAGHQKNSETWTREWALGALLSQLPSREAARQSLATLHLPARSKPSDVSRRFSVEGVLKAYDFYHGQTEQSLRHKTRHGLPSSHGYDPRYLRSLGNF